MTCSLAGWLAGWQRTCHVRSYIDSGHMMAKVRMLATNFWLNSLCLNNNKSSHCGVTISAGCATKTERKRTKDILFSLIIPVAAKVAEEADATSLAAPKNLKQTGNWGTRKCDLRNTELPLDEAYIFHKFKTANGFYILICLVFGCHLCTHQIMWTQTSFKILWIYMCVCGGLRSGDFYQLMLFFNL